ncbi:OsmC family protein [Vibrio ziniensis]|uniref:OsmC family peroxiredoxin n=1 Tax=Vibrio ziniensis TaxID=2711221 RepID=A0A6G7CQ00_9VIBR|nr:OsmC family protein [Vibrio ziniensis]QIH44185.1 OsmC family peroxiredoxin [Vibrio ziniensis]
MSKHTAKVSWCRRDGEVFSDNKYSRAHIWEFDGGVVVPASPSPSVVPLPYSVEANVDPEEAFVAALSSCHMLVFLSIAAKKRYVVDGYSDEAEGLLELDEQNKESITKVVLRPKVTFVGENKPSIQILEKMHHQAHENCFIANSVKTKVITEIVY